MLITHAYDNCVKPCFQNKCYMNVFVTIELWKVDLLSQQGQNGDGLFHLIFLDF